MKNIVKFYGKANVSLTKEGLYTYLAPADEDYYMRNRLNPYIDDILHIDVYDIINRGYFKNRDKLRAEGARVLTEKGYDALFELASYWIDHNMLAIEGSVSKHVILYNCDEDYRFKYCYHRKFIEKLKELGLYDMEFKRRLNKIKRCYKNMNPDDVIETKSNTIKSNSTTSKPKELIGTADILVTVDNKYIFSDGFKGLLRRIESGRYSVLTDYVSYIRLVHQKNDYYDCRNRENRMKIDDNFNNHLKSNGLKWNGFCYELRRFDDPVLFDSLIKLIKMYWEKYSQYVDKLYIK